MRELRFVTLDESAGHLVVETHGLEDDAGERFRLPVDEALRAALSQPAHVAAHSVPDEGTAPTARPEPAVSEAPRRPLPSPPTAAPTAPPPPAASSDPAISPREIQVRVRAGEVPEEIAEAFNANLSWVMRFAGPVIEERSRMTDEARRARARRSTSDAQTVIFGETVDERFTAHGIDPSLVGWDTHRREDGQWIVTASWVGGESERLAEWSFNLAARSVSPIDETATDLLSDRPIRPVHTGGPVTLSVAPPLTPGVVAFPAMPNAHTGPLPTREQLFDQQMFEDAAARSAPVAQPPAPAAVLTFDAPPLPLGTIEQFPEREPVNLDSDVLPDLEADHDAPSEPLDLFDEPEAAAEEPTVQLPTIKNLGVAHRESETDEERAARAHIPSWDDILLGVRRKGD